MGYSQHMFKQCIFEKLSENNFVDQDLEKLQGFRKKESIHESQAAKFNDDKSMYTEHFDKTTKTSRKIEKMSDYILNHQNQF